MKPGRKLGRSTVPAVQVRAVSARKEALPDCTPLTKAPVCKAGLDTAPTAASVAAQFAARYCVPLPICAGVQGSVKKLELLNRGWNSSPMLGARPAWP